MGVNGGRCTVTDMSDSSRFYLFGLLLEGQYPAEFSSNTKEILYTDPANPCLTRNFFVGVKLCRTVALQGCFKTPLLYMKCTSKLSVNKFNKIL